MTLASTRSRAGRRSLVRIGAAIVAGAWIGMAAIPAQADDSYDAKRAGNPVRIAAYVLHPVGVMLDYLIFRPAWWVGHQEPFKTLFGVTD